MASSSTRNISAPAGYYCTNNVKTDYNVANAGQPWDESSNRAHYKNRGPAQPFFAVFNFTTSHESQVAPKPGKTTFRVPPDKIPLPPYHPDTPDIRRDWANYYDQMTLMDKQAGQLLTELGVRDWLKTRWSSTTATTAARLPQGKRNLHDSGTRVPLIVRVPKKWAHLAPVRPGEWADDPVSFVDLPATVFSLCGVPIPEHFEGRPFLGEKAQPHARISLPRPHGRAARHGPRGSRRAGPLHPQLLAPPALGAALLPIRSRSCPA